ncbi:MAG: hypothetical protein FWD65_03715 [Coriobacteriia bacterium]|nr:hypothetical protein [Coriobacteriia bacterium]
MRKRVPKATLVIALLLVGALTACACEQKLTAKKADVAISSPAPSSTTAGDMASKPATTTAEVLPEKPQPVPASAAGIKLDDRKIVKNAYDQSGSKATLGPRAGIQLKKSVVMCCSNNESEFDYTLVEVYPTQNGPKVRTLAADVSGYGRSKLQKNVLTEVVSCIGEKATITTTYDDDGALTGMASTINYPSPELEKKGQEFHTTDYGSAEQNAIFAALTPALEKELGGAVELDIGTIRVENNFAFVDARAPEADNHPPEGSPPRLYGLLKRKGSIWKVVTCTTGGRVDYAGWWDNSGAPSRLFFEDLPVNAWLPLVGDTGD